MPWKNEETKRQYDKEYAEKNCKRYAVKFQISTGIPAAMQKVLDAGCSANAYIGQAVKEALIRDGYLSEKSEKAK